MCVYSLRIVSMDKILHLINTLKFNTDYKYKGQIPVLAIAILDRVFSYRDQFEMLVGKLVKDREDMVAREQAHQKVSITTEAMAKAEAKKDSGMWRLESFVDHPKMPW